MVSISILSIELETGRIPFPIRHWKTPKFTQFFAPDEQKAPELLRGPSLLLPWSKPSKQPTGLSP